MSFGPGDVIGGRYELIRMLGGGPAGLVYLAYDRHLARELVVRFVEPGDPAAAAALLEEGRRLASAQFDSLQGIPVLDAGEIAGGGAYVASELVDGIPLEVVIQRRAPVPLRDARRFAVELLDACLAMRRHEAGRVDTIVGSALVTSDRHIRVTRFARAAPGPGGAEPAVAHVAATLSELLAGGEVPGDLRRTIDDARSGHVRTADELRARLLVGAYGDPEGRAEEPAHGPPRARWPWIVVAIAAVLVTALVVLLVLVSADGDADQGATVPATTGSDAGSAAVPVLLGLTEAAAVRAIADAGFEARVLEGASDAVNAGLVSAQDPAAGREIATGATVAVTVSTGPEPVAVPDLAGETVAGASQLLRGLGLALGTVSEEPADGTPVGQIIDQDPNPSARVAPGTAVDVVTAAPGTSTGPG